MWKIKSRKQDLKKHIQKTHKAMSLQWSDFGGNVRSPTKCTILFRIWSDF